MKYAFSTTNVALADWSATRRHAKITALNDHVASASAIVEQLRPFEMVCIKKLIASRQSLTERNANAAGAILVDKQILSRDTDVVTAHLVFARTKGLIGAAELALMTPTARFVNTSRSPIVNEAALIEALSARRIVGGCVRILHGAAVSGSSLSEAEERPPDPLIGYVADERYRAFYDDASANITKRHEANVASA